MVSFHIYPPAIVVITFWYKQLLDAFLIQAIAAPCIINIPAGRLISRTA
jgi:hypothetical protein